MCILRLDARGWPELVQRDATGILAGMWGPVMAESLDVDSLAYLGEVHHVLSHRDMHIRVWKGAVDSGVDPQRPAFFLGCENTQPWWCGIRHGRGAS